MNNRNPTFDFSSRAILHAVKRLAYERFTKELPADSMYICGVKSIHYIFVQLMFMFATKMPNWFVWRYTLPFHIPISLLLMYFFDCKPKYGTVVGDALILYITKYLSQLPFDKPISIAFQDPEKNEVQVSSLAPLLYWYVLHKICKITDEHIKSAWGDVCLKFAVDNVVGVVVGARSSDARYTFIRRMKYSFFFFLFFSFLSHILQWSMGNGRQPHQHYWSLIVKIDIILYMNKLVF